MRPTCPYCGKVGDDRCGHLLVRIDESFGEYEGEAWAAKVVPALSKLDEAAVGLAGRLGDAPKAVSATARDWIEAKGLTEAFEYLEGQVEGGDTLVGLADGGDEGWAAFLRGLLEAVSEPAESEFDGGQPGMSSRETYYWAAEPGEAAGTLAKVLRQEARELEALGRKRARARAKSRGP